MTSKAYLTSASSSRRSSRKAMYEPCEKKHLRVIASLLPDWTEQQRKVMKYVRIIFPFSMEQEHEKHRAYAIVEAAQYRGDSYRDAHDFFLGLVSDRHDLNGDLHPEISPCEYCLEWRKARQDDVSRNP